MDILLSDKNPNHATEPSLAEYSISTKQLPSYEIIEFPVSYSTVSRSMIYAQFDKSLSRGENKEEFGVRVQPSFMFKGVERATVDSFVGSGYFKRIIDTLLPTSPNDPNSLYGVGLQVVAGVNWIYSAIAYDLRHNQINTEQQLQMPGFTAENMNEVQENCKQSCGLCESPDDQDGDEHPYKI